MIKKIIGATVGTPTSPKMLERKLKPVKSVNGAEPDENGNVELTIPKPSDGVSPTITVADIAGGHRITITDVNGTKTFDVMDSAGGGLIVTVTDNTASHTAEEILSHINNGGNAVLMIGDVVYNFAGRNPGMDSGDEQNVAFLNVNGEDDDFTLAYVTGRKVSYYRFNPGNKITAPEKAKIGQALVVKATDAFDYPTDWEAVDIGSGGLVVTVTGNVSSKSSAEIVAHVKAGGTVVLQSGGNLYNFVNYSEDGSGACFMMVDPMDGEYLETATVSGTRVTFYTLPFALDKDVIKTVNGVEPDENGNVDVAGVGMVVTVTDDISSKTSAEIAAHVKTGGSVVLNRYGDVFSFIYYDENTNAALFIRIDPMDGEYIEQVEVSGNKVSFYKMPFALKSEVVKTVNGVQPDENGNVEVAGEGGVDVSVGTTVIIPETHFSEEGGNGYTWDGLEGILFNMKVPPVIGETYIMTVNGVSYEAVATEGTYGVLIIHEDADGNVVTLQYAPAYYIDWGNFNSCFYSDYWEFEGEDGFVVPETTTISLTQKVNALGDVVIVKSVDENGKPKELETCNLLENGRSVFPETYFEGTGEESSTGEGWKWFAPEGLFFNIKEPLVAGKTYSVTINGAVYNLIARKPDRTWYSDNEVELAMEELFRIRYFSYSEDGENFNTCFVPDFWTESGEDGPLMQSITIGIEVPTTIKNEYLDMGAIVAAVKAQLGM